MATLVLVRHGETHWNREGRLQGWQDSSLTEQGRQQARDLATRLTSYDIDRTVVSDLGRARETAAILQEAGVSPEPTPDAEWRERSLGVYQGQTREEVSERDPEAVEDARVALDTTPEDGESLEAFQDRVVGAAESLAGSLADEETALVVTHGGPIRIALIEAEAMPLRASFRDLSPPNCSRSVFTAVDGLTLVETDVDY